MTDFFPRGSVSRRINAEPAIICGAGRALLLQVAHPAVAQGVADHSDFRDNPFRRLQGTLEALNAVVYGSDALAFAVGRRVAQLHDHVVGETYRVKRSDGRHHYKHSTKRCNDHLNPQQIWRGLRFDVQVIASAHTNSSKVRARSAHSFTE